MTKAKNLRKEVFKHPLAEIRRQKKEFKQRFGVWPNCLEAGGEIAKLLPRRKKGLGGGELVAEKILGMDACSTSGMPDMSILTVSLRNFEEGYFSNDMLRL